MEGEGRKLGILVRTLVGHGHRVNTLALSCEAALRTGPFGREDCAIRSLSGVAPEAARAAALERYNRARWAPGRMDLDSTRCPTAPLLRLLPPLPDPPRAWIVLV